MDIDYLMVNKKQLNGKLRTFILLSLVTGFWIRSVATAFFSEADLAGSFPWLSLICFFVLCICWPILVVSLIKSRRNWQSKSLATFEEHEQQIKEILNRQTDSESAEIANIASCRHEKLTVTLKELHSLISNHLNNVTTETNEAALNLIDQFKLIHDAMSHLLQKVSDNRKKSDQMASGSQTTLEDNQKTMNRLQRYIDNRLNEIAHDHIMASELQEQAVIMADLTKLIESVAKQTTIVATNAKIEASRAGAFGKAFGVIADEVTMLSAQTGDSSKQIIQSIDHMGKSIEEKFKVKLDKAAQAEERSLLNSLKGQLVNIGNSYQQLEKFNRETLAGINSSSEEIKSKVNDSLMAIQFQDITQQQIEVILKSLNLFETHLSGKTCFNMSEAEQEIEQEFDINRIRALYVMKKQHDIHNKHQKIKALSPTQREEGNSGEITFF